MSRKTRNEWGGFDWRGPAGVARATIDDGAASVISLDANECLVWQATFGQGTPAAVINAAIYAARAAAGYGR